MSTDDACDDGFSNTIDDVYQVTARAAQVPTGPAGIEVEEYATSEYGTTYRVYATFDAPTNELIAVYGTVSEAQNAPLSVVSTTGFYNPETGADFGQDINPAFFGFFPELEFDSWFTIGANSNGWRYQFRRLEHFPSSTPVMALQLMRSGASVCGSGDQ